MLTGAGSTFFASDDFFLGIIHRFYEYGLDILSCNIKSYHLAVHETAGSLYTPTIPAL